MERVKVCLVSPRFKYISGDPPMGVGYLASYLKKVLKADISIIDTTKMNFKVYLEYLKSAII